MRGMPVVVQVPTRGAVHEPILVARAAEDRLRPGLAVHDDVVPGTGEVLDAVVAADEEVVAFAAEEDVAAEAWTAAQGVVAGTAVQGIVAVAAEQDVVAGSAKD